MTNVTINPPLLKKIEIPLSWSHTAHPIAANAERDDQQPDAQETKASNGILAP